MHIDFPKHIRGMWTTNLIFQAAFTGNFKKQQEDKLDQVSLFVEEKMGLSTLLP